MNSTTQRQLNDLNLRFYSDRADEFGSTRQHGWPGWKETLRAIDPQKYKEPFQVLDIACGNGRFAHFLDQSELFEDLYYLGLDQSEELLSAAKKQCISFKSLTERNFRNVNVVGDDLQKEISQSDFDLIVAFGFLHHVPGFQTRQRLISLLAHQLRPHGILAFTTWQFDQSPRFKEKIIPWTDYNRLAAEPIDLEELEDGDYLMSFGEKTRTPRYCHASSPTETKALFEELDLELLHQFKADGKTNDLNEYYILKRSLTV